MFKTIDYRTTRALQICIVFAVTLAIQNWFRFAHAAWTGFAVMMIYAGFDAGAVMQRTFHRFWGALLGLLLSYILWFIGHIDYRLLFMIIPLTVFLAYFSLGKLYAIPTIFTVTLTALGTDFYSNDTYFVAWFFSDYFICTVIALIICAIFEYAVFKHSNLTHKFYASLQQDVIYNLHDLFSVVTANTLNQSKYLKYTVRFNQKVLEFNNFVTTVVHDYHAQDNLLAKLEVFSHEMKIAYNNIRKLFVLFPQQPINLQQETLQLITHLTRLTQTEEDKIIQGVIID
ncbi:MAG: FUSC family protein [Burkholderiales bacterium]|nr:FUSC family protein [Burkholderiales bacterium]